MFVLISLSWVSCHIGIILFYCFVIAYNNGNLHELHTNRRVSLERKAKKSPPSSMQLYDFIIYLLFSSYDHPTYIIWKLRTLSCGVEEWTSKKWRRFLAHFEFFLYSSHQTLKSVFLYFHHICHFYCKRLNRASCRFGIVTETSNK